MLVGYIEVCFFNVLSLRFSVLLIQMKYELCDVFVRLLERERMSTDIRAFARMSQ